MRKPQKYRGIVQAIWIEPTGAVYQFAHCKVRMHRMNPELALRIAVRQSLSSHFSGEFFLERYQVDLNNTSWRGSFLQDIISRRDIRVQGVPSIRSHLLLKITVKKKILISMRGNSYPSSWRIFIRVP